MGKTKIVKLKTSKLGVKQLRVELEEGIINSLGENMGMCDIVIESSKGTRLCSLSVSSVEGEPFTIALFPKGENITVFNVDVKDTKPLGDIKVARLVYSKEG